MQISQHERALREFTCGICKGVLEQPLCMPCNHAFCKPCLLKTVRWCSACAAWCVP